MVDAHDRGERRATTCPVAPFAELLKDGRQSFRVFLLVSHRWEGHAVEWMRSGRYARRISSRRAIGLDAIPRVRKPLSQPRF